MNQEVERRLAESLTFAGSTDIIPYLPYLLKDFWSLGSEPEEMANLLHLHTDFNSDFQILDLACGKGAVSICLAKEFGCTVKGIDLMSEFIAEAKAKAEEFGVSGQCDFMVGDVNDAVTNEREYDLIIWGAAGDLLGSYPETLAGIARTIKSCGYILLDDCYIPSAHQCLRFHHDYLTKEQWEHVFLENGVTVIACNEAIQEVNPSVYADDLGNIRRRAEELIRQHPDKREMFENYVKSQQAEYEDLQDGVIPALWLLKKQIKI